MRSRNDARAEVADAVVLDGRLALSHQKQEWLAVADLHFGFELSQRAAGNLFPLWGMQTIQKAWTHLNSIRTSSNMIDPEVGSIVRQFSDS